MTKFFITSLQVTDIELRAIGGYFKESNAKVFPGPATLKRDKGGLDSVWKEDRNEIDPKRQRAGFMTAEIPWPWINCTLKARHKRNCDT